MGACEGPRVIGREEAYNGNYMVKERETLLLQALIL